MSAKVGGHKPRDISQKKPRPPTAVIPPVQNNFFTPSAARDVIQPRSTHRVSSRPRPQTAKIPKQKMGNSRSTQLIQDIKKIEKVEETQLI